LPFFALEAPRAPQAAVPLATLLQRYERLYLSQLAASTRRHHGVILRKLCTHYGDLPLTALTPDWVRQWQEAITPGHTVGTVRQYLVTLSGVLTWAVEIGWLADHPMEKMRKPSVPPGRVRFLSAEEYQRLLAACRRSANPFLYLLIVLGVSTGCRRTELCRLRWPEVDLERGLVRLVTTKNKHPRAVPVTGVALELLRAHAATPRAGAVDWLFPRRDGLQPVAIEQAWRPTRFRAGLVDFRFHDLRHTCASYLAMSGASLLDIAEVLGHKKLDMVKRYAHLTEAHTRGVLARMTEKHVGGACGAPALDHAQEGARHDHE
jgi:integrase